MVNLSKFPSPFVKLIHWTTEIHWFCYFAHTLTQMSLDDHLNLPPTLHIASGLSKSLSAPPTPPFGYPLSALGLSLFDADPSRILSILHHQTILAEEALR